MVVLGAEVVVVVGNEVVVVLGVEVVVVVGNEVVVVLGVEVVVVVGTEVVVVLGVEVVVVVGTEVVVVLGVGVVVVVGAEVVVVDDGVPEPDPVLGSSPIEIKKSVHRLPTLPFEGGGMLTWTLLLLLSSRFTQGCAGWRRMVLFWPMPVVLWMPSCETVTGLASQWSSGGVGESGCMGKEVGAVVDCC